MSMVEELAGFITRSGMNVIRAERTPAARSGRSSFSTRARIRSAALTLLHHGARYSSSTTGQLIQQTLIARRRIGRQGTRHRASRRSSGSLVQKGANAPGKHRASMLQDVSSQASDRSRFHERRNREMPERRPVFRRRSNRASLAADQGTSGTFLDRSGLSESYKPRVREPVRMSGPKMSLRSQ